MASRGRRAVRCPPLRPRLPPSRTYSVRYSECWLHFLTKGSGAKILGNFPRFNSLFFSMLWVLMDFLLIFLRKILPGL